MKSVKFSHDPESDDLPPYNPRFRRVHARIGVSAVEPDSDSEPDNELIPLFPTPLVHQFAQASPSDRLLPAVLALASESDDELSLSSPRSNPKKR